MKTRLILDEAARRDVLGIHRSALRDQCRALFLERLNLQASMENV